MSWGTRAGALLLAAVALANGSGSASARNCYEGIGCPWKEEARVAELRKLSCDNLSHVRNQLYKERGYCFHTPEFVKRYGNEGCRFPVQELVPLGRIERENVARVRRVEREKGC